MLHIVQRFRRAGAARRLFEEARYAADLFSHPAFRAMSARERADLPRPRR
jgi:hypothetical protein